MEFAMAPDASPKIPAFHTTGLTKTYHQGEVEVHALRGVDLSLYSGELVVMLGASGSGKSTRLNILGGLDVPSRAGNWMTATGFGFADMRYPQSGRSLTARFAPPPYLPIHRNRPLPYPPAG